MRNICKITIDIIDELDPTSLDCAKNDYFLYSEKREKEAKSSGGDRPKLRRWRLCCGRRKPIEAPARRSDLNMPPFVRTLPAAALRILSRSFLVSKFLALNFVSVSTYSVPLPRVVAAGGRRSGG